MHFFFSKFIASTWLLNSFDNFLLMKWYLGIVLKQAVTSQYLLFHQTIGNIFIFSYCYFSNGSLHSFDLALT